MADGPRTLFIACGALAREFLAVSKANAWDGRIEITCLPAVWHNRPDKIPEGVRRKIRAGKKRFDRIFVLYGDCGTGGELDRVLAEEGVERIEGPHCYQWFAGTANFERLMEEEPGTFFLTDYLVRHFDRLMWQGLGLDRHPDLLEAYFGNYRKLVYLAQLDDPALVEKARQAAERLKLEFVHRRTGYGELADFITAKMA
jgi:hypothetical protein